MDLLDLYPEDLIHQHILPLLPINDILRLRRVCKATKAVADNYLCVNGVERNLQIEIDADAEQDGKSFERFLELGFSISRLILKTKGVKGLYTEKALEFLEKHGAKIKELIVDNMYCGYEPEEVNFYCELSNVTSLEIENLHLAEAHWNEGFFPECSQNLKTLKINTVLTPTEDFKLGTDDYAYVFLESSLQVEHLKFPVYKHLPSNTEMVNGLLLKLMACISRGCFQDEPCLKVVDISAFQGDLLCDQSFYFFTEFCYRVSKDAVKIKPMLLGVDANFILVLKANVWEAIAPLVLSTINISERMFSGNANSIEEIYVASSSNCGIPLWKNADIIYWSNTKRLTVRMDDPGLIKMAALGLLCPKYYDMFKNKLRCSTARHALTEMALIYEERPRVHYNCPSARSFVESYPNLQKLTLTNWPGTNKALSVIWSGLQHLEEVCLDGCKNMGNVAFVGEDKDKPVFLQLQKLKKLNLMNVDKMPKITDTLFTLVIRHLKLTHFHLHSTEPIENVTASGIRALLTGDFAESIEKFPFEGWSLSSLPMESVEELANQFRSSRIM